MGKRDRAASGGSGEWLHRHPGPAWARHRSEYRRNSPASLPAGEFVTAVSGWLGKAKKRLGALTNPVPHGTAHLRLIGSRNRYSTASTSFSLSRDASYSTISLSIEGASCTR